MALTIKHSITLDFSHNSKRVTIPFSRGDKVAHEIDFVLRHETDYIEITNKTRAYIVVQNGVKSQYTDVEGKIKVGTGVVSECLVNFEKQIISWQVSAAALEISGEIPVILILADENGANIGTDVFYFSVEETGMVDVEKEVSAALKASSSWDLIAKISNDAELIKIIEERVMLENLVMVLKVQKGENVTFDIDTPYSIDWGDGNREYWRGSEKAVSLSHTYETEGVYQCIIYGLKIINANSFSGIGSIKSIFVGNGISYIGNGAFSDCPILSEVSISDGVRTIGNEAFSNCTKLEKISFGDSIDMVGENVFAKTKLSHLDLPDSLRVIPTNMFSDCSVLSTVSFGKYTSIIGAWSNCPKLKNVEFRGVVPPVIPIDTLNFVEEILVGRECYDAYVSLYPDIAGKIIKFATTEELKNIDEKLSNHKTDKTAHEDIRRTAKTALEKIENFLAGITDEKRDQLFEVLELIAKHEGDVTKSLSEKVKYSDIVDSLESTNEKLVLSAKQGSVLKEFIDLLSTNKLDRNSLPSVIETTLTQAKESGKFDGAQGKTGLDALVVSQFVEFSDQITVDSTHQLLIASVNRVPIVNDSLLVIGLYSDDVYKVIAKVISVDDLSFTYKVTNIVQINGRGIQDISFVEDEKNNQKKVIIEYSDGSLKSDLTIPNGDTPYIKNDTWWIGETDTGIKAEGPPGKDYILTDDDKQKIAGLIDNRGYLTEVNEETVVFKDDLVTTYEMGNYKLKNGMATIPAKGKTLKKVWETIYMQEKQPTITQPSYTFTASGGSGEVGTSFTLPTATFKVTSVGSYSYNDTGIKFSGSITGGDNTKSFENLTTGDVATVKTSGNATTYTDDAIQFSFSGKYSYNEGATPLTNLGNEADKDRIVAVTDKAISTSCSFTGYRKMFIGCLTSEQKDFTSDEVRAFDKVSTKASTSTQSFTVPSGTKQIVVAYPASLTSNSAKTPTFEYEALGQWFTEGNIKQLASVEVEGANGASAVTYYIYSYTHTGTFASDTNYKITI